MNSVAVNQIVVNHQQWLVADPDASRGVDMAHRWGHEDATEGNGRNGSLFVMCSAEYNAYHQGYNEGLRLRQQLTGDVCRGALDEAAWFDEIAEAAPCVTIHDEAFEDMEEEWIGNAFSREPYNW